MRDPTDRQVVKMSHRAVFLDRDGTLIEHYDYITEVSQVKLLPRTAEPLRRLKDRGYRLVMVTNQSGVARGMLTEKKLLEIHDYLKSLLAEQGVYLDQIYYCPYHPEGVVEKYRRDSELRKPQPGMMKLAARDLDIDLARSWLIGDDDRDILAGQAAGCRTILLEQRGSALVRRGEAQATYRAVNFQEAANLIIRYGDQATSSASGLSIALKPAEEIAPGPAPVVGERMEEFLTPPQDPPAPKSDKAKRKLPERVPPQEHAPLETILNVTLESVADVDTVLSEPPEKTRSRQEMPGTKVLLAQILREVKSMNRQQRFTDFSVAKLMAGLLQMIVILCLILAYMFGSGMEPRPDRMQTCLFLSLIFQTMALTLLTIHRQ